ncbi:MAG: serine/threonine-protein kinase [Thermoanaerobaculia bacterium]
MSDAGDERDPLDGDTDYRPTPPSGDGRRQALSRFTPGTLLGDRYRIVALLGSGGMGEVYRADDLKLGQQVALKFLPEHLSRDPHRIERLYAEVRIGRQVSHPNVCRLYDIGQWEQHHFLAMEYVDGEDLASLLRRIGKLPHGKALDLARDICAGLAAAHGVGIVHRDLKPANIMIDGRGNARITDFGLAAVAEEIAGRSEVVGTPLYMAPEQLAGENVSPKTDLYALGLILFEMFTGRRLFESASSDLAARRSITASQSLSSHTRELEPAVQRVILRCLEEKPEARPASIHSVIAALPGGDPLQAAVDAGETPSPQMVAAAGETGVLKPRVAGALLLSAAIGLILTAMLYGHAVLFRRVPLPKEPAVLIERARTIIERAGYGDAPAGSAYYFAVNPHVFDYTRKHAKPGNPWESIARARPGIFTFGYRQSPRPMISGNADGRVISGDPPNTIPGMAEVFVDTRGRLLGFSAVPPDTRSGATTPPDWGIFFAEAGGDFVNLTPVQPLWSPPFSSDHQFAWTARYRDDPTPVRIEAASANGKAVWFEIIGPWKQPVQPVPAARPVAETVLSRIGILVGTIGPFFGAVILARRNLRRGRGDRRSALRLAFFVFGSLLIARVLRLDHVSDWDGEWSLLTRAMAWSLFEAMQTWVFYIAIEPYIRRRWPQLMIGWTRLFNGRWRDPMIGRDALIGAVAGLTMASLGLLVVILPAWFGGTALDPITQWISPLVSIRNLLYLGLTKLVETGIMLPLVIVVILVLLIPVLRRRPYALAAIWILMSLFINGSGAGMAWRIGVGAIMATIAVGVLARYGLLAFAITIFIEDFVTSAPITLEPGAWYFGRSTAVLIALFAIAVYGCFVSIADQPLFGPGALEDL